MATDHELRLRAVLDTTDVQKKLEKLRSAQNAENSNKAQPMNSNLNQVLGRLSNTIHNLQVAVDRLNQFQMKSRMQVSSPTVISAGRVRIPELKAPQAGVLKDIQLFTNRINSIFKDLNSLKIPDAAVMKSIGKSVKQFKAGKITGRQLWERMSLYDDYSVVEAFQEKYPTAASFQKKITNLRRNQLKNSALLNQFTPQPLVNPQGRGISVEQVKAGLGFAVGNTLQGAASYAEATGNTKIAKGLQTGSNVLMGGASGAAIGSMIAPGIGTTVGAVIGAVSSGLKSAFDNLAESARDAAAALEKQRSSMFSGQQIDVGMYKFMQGQTDKAALKKKDVAYFQQRLTDAQELNERQRKSLESEVGLDLGKGKRAEFNLREYEKETLAMMQRGISKDDPEVIRRKNVAKVYAANAKGFQESTVDIDNLRNILEEFKKADTLKGLNEDLDKLQQAFSEIKAPSMDQVNSLASQGFMIDASDDQARYEAQIDYLKQIADLTREIKDKQDQIKNVQIQ